MKNPKDMTDEEVKAAAKDHGPCPGCFLCFEVMMLELSLRKDIPWRRPEVKA
jgi:hypothetical protein